MCVEVDVCKELHMQCVCARVWKGCIYVHADVCVVVCV